jgi:hypothetical protein
MNLKGLLVSAAGLEPATHAFKRVAKLTPHNARPAYSMLNTLKSIRYQQDIRLGARRVPRIRCIERITDGRWHISRGI